MTHLSMKSIYKQHKPLSLSSGLWALFITALVLVMAASANAEDYGTSATPNRPAIKKEEVKAAPAVRPSGMEQKRASSTTDNRLANQPARDPKMWAATMASSTAARRAEWETKRKAMEVKFEERKASLEERRAALASTTAARKAALAEKVQEHIKQAGERAEQVLTKAIGKIRELSSRLRARASELEGRGVDTTEVKALLTEVDETLVAAENALSGIEVNVEYTATSDNPKNAWVDARAQFKEVHELVKQAHGLLREALAALKAAVAEANLARGTSEAVRKDDSKPATSTITQ